MDPHKMAADHAPTPFTADEIRIGCPAGRTMTLAVDERDAEPYRLRIRFVTVDEQGATQQTQRLARDGSPLDDVVSRHSSWTELQRHASYPEKSTTIADAMLETRLGRLTCRHYTVDRPGGIDQFWFDVGRPGMPVRVETSDDQGLVYRMVMIDDVVDP